jgi:hypothetical protein
MTEDDIRKIYLQRLDEAQKTRNASLAIYIALVFSAAVIMFSTHVSEAQIKIPLLDIKMEKENGVEIILLVSLVLLFRYFSVNAHISLVSAKLERLSTGLTDELTTLPSTLSSFTLVWQTFKQKCHSPACVALLIAIPIGLAAYSGVCQIRSKPNLPKSLAITFLADLVLAGLSIIITRRAYKFANAEPSGPEELPAKE